MFARRIVAKHVTKTPAMAMLGATAILSVLQILFTYLGELGSLKEGYGAWDALRYVLWGVEQVWEANFVNVDVGALLGKPAGGPGMVEVDMGEKGVGDVGGG